MLYSEKFVNEKLSGEKAKFRGMLDEYSEFIDKIVKEKMQNTQYYEKVAKENEKLRAKVREFEVSMNRLLLFLPILCYLSN